MIIWLASYPRSGNTFLRIILKNKFGISSYSIYDDVADIGADEETSNVVGHAFLPEGFDIEEARADEKKYYIKTHELPVEHVAEEDKVIYLIRDGRESLYSLVKHQRKYGKTDISISDALNGNIFGGTWSDHVAAWSPNTRKKCLLIKYEDLVNSVDTQIEVLSEFIDADINEVPLPKFEYLHDINPLFFNSGKIDSWKSVYTEEDSYLFWIKNYTQMKEYGYVESMPEIFESAEYLKLFRAISDENTYLLKTYLTHHDSLKNIVAEYATIYPRAKKYEEENAGLQDKLRIARENSDKFKEEIIELSNELHREQDELRIARENSDKFKEEIIELSNELHREQDELRIARENSDKFKEEIIELLNELHREQDELRIARDNSDKFKEEWIELSNELYREKEFYNYIIENKTIEIDRLQKQLNTLREQVLLKQQESETMSRRLEHINKETNKAMRDRDIYLDKHNVLNAEVIELRKSNKNFEQINKTLESELNQSRALVNDIYSSRRWRYVTRMLSIFKKT